jgi:hypothetical protein
MTDKTRFREALALATGQFNRNLRHNRLGMMGPGYAASKTVLGGPAGHIAGILGASNLSAAQPIRVPSTNYTPETQTITSATTMAPTTNNETLVGMWLTGGAGPSWLELTAKSPNKLIFPALHSGISDATGSFGMARPLFYPMNWAIPGTTGIASGSQTFGGDLASVDFLYATTNNPGGIDLNGLEWRGEASAADETGTSGTNTTYTFTAGKSRPVSFMAVANIEATASAIARAHILFPKIGSYAQYSVPCYNPVERLPHLWAVPYYDGSTTIVLVHKADSLGGSTNVTVGGYLYYVPA